MITRRDFLETAIAAAAAAHMRPLAAAQRTGAAGANERIRVGLIGCGNRGNQVASDWMRHKDSVFVAACDVAKDRVEKTAARLGGVQSNTVDPFEDYRRILDRKDVDAVFIATPDHWHAPMTIEACAAGKDVYVEKPVSNEIAPALKMVEAARRYNRVVQVGQQQRSWHHFQEAARLFQDGYIGSSVNHCQMCPPVSGGGGRGQPQPEKPQAPPPGFNWEMFQGPATRKPFNPARRNWRGWYDYGGGNLTDWGVHLTDVMNWYMRADAPVLASASAQYVRLPRDPERVPDTYSVTWQYETFVATLSNAMVPGIGNPTERYGNYFFGDRGVLLVNRYGYEVMPYPPPAAGRGQNPSALPPQPLEPKTFKDPNGMSEVVESQFGSATHRHVRNFLDAVKSRQKPNCDIDVGFNSALPCLLAIVSVKTGKTVKWDGKEARTT